MKKETIYLIIISIVLLISLVTTIFMFKPIQIENHYYDQEITPKFDCWLIEQSHNEFKVNCEVDYEAHNKD